MLKLAVRAEYRIKGRCSRHPAYNPVKDEQGGIRGECRSCHELLMPIGPMWREARRWRSSKPRLSRSSPLRRREEADGPPAAAPASPTPIAQRQRPENANLIDPEALSEIRK